MPFEFLATDRRKMFIVNPKTDSVEFSTNSVVPVYWAAIAVRPTSRRRASSGGQFLRLLVGVVLGTEPTPASSARGFLANHRLRRRRGGSMAVRAYVLIQTEVGRSAHVSTEVARLQGVVSTADVTGPYDVIVQVEADSIDDLGKMVVSRMQLTDGVTRTLTCPIVNL